MLIKQLEPLLFLLSEHEDVDEIIHRIRAYPPDKQKRIYLMLADIVAHDTLELLNLYGHDSHGEQQKIYQGRLTKRSH